ncbi:MAG: aminopeptidase [Clostridia bacterium]|nr:aminopeptidase [Clostridia bacterium]
MVSQEKLKKYAALAVRMGVNVQKGQLMVLTSSVDCARFARMCVEEAYQAGAGEVQVVWTDEQTDRLRFEYEGSGTLSHVAPWKVEQKRNAIDRKACFLYIDSDTPGLLAHIPGDKLQAANLARRTAMEPFQYYTMANHGQWSIVAIPTEAWAKKVFPGYEPGKALEKLWDAVLMSVRIEDGNDPVTAWKIHDEALAANSRKLNEYDFKALHFQNKLGTDLTLELIENHVWAGGGTEGRNGAFFNPNMPTEEVFCMPAKFGVNGTVAATKPLDYQGKLIEDFRLTFRDGKVVEYRARVAEDALKNLLTADDGSSYLGEVALVPYNSPISNSGVLFLNTLFDENASCHLALGAAYPENVRGGEDMTREELTALGSNYSKEHCDFMFGSADMCIQGIRKDGSRVTIFEDGDFNPAAGFRRG